ncbi:MAG: hypothetical protein HOP12_06910 [Candidatus Eisenbacteria bacterium]|uniref:LTD domain-containing protein n=1 Tax=Eiseniibacteriota bacterium TaxID=2212470 RepID=A0A849SMQ3_UNCEI|nr:hypothetical protein [Candidatus Eisenbacteria bacterium]
MGQPRHFCILARNCFATLALTAATLLLPAAPVSAQILINEILPNPFGNDVGTERVEIFNAGASPVNLTGWGIDDAVTIGQAAVRARIPEDFDATCSTNATIGPGEFRVVMMQGGSAVLNNGGDDVYLVSDRLLAATVVHSVTYPSATAFEGQVWSAIPNGSSNFAFRSPTLCGSNAGIGDVTAPGTVSNLLAVPGAFPGEIRLTWTAPGDDGATGTASAYIIKVSHDPINAGNFDAALDINRWIAEPLPLVAGAAETLFVFGLATDSTWHFALKTQDEVPNTSSVSNDSGTAPLAGLLLNPDTGYTPYFGNLHSHTSYSDGVQTPAQAYDYARNGAPTALDFLAVTDHNHSGAGMQLSNYSLGLAQAAAANDDGDFVAIWGQEWGIIESGGHANVFEAPTLFGWQAGNYDVFVAEGDYTGLYTALLANPPSGYPPIVEWCHPASGDFNNYAVTPNGQSVVSLMALITGPAFSTSTTESDVGSTTGNEVLFQDALRLGFRISPAGDQDNHNATWGAATETRTVALAAGKTKSEILGALATRRNYASQDHNVVVQFSADGRPMGSAWTSAQGVRFAVRVIDPDLTDGVAQIDLLRGVTGTSNAAVVATSVGNSSFAWRERSSFAPGTEAHYYMRIRMNDNANVWTGPVYVDYDPASVVGVGDRDHAIELAMSAHPNPAFGRVTASFALPNPARRAALVIYDAAGRRVKSLIDGPLSAGSHQVVWTGLDDAGRPASAGIFFMRLETDDRSVVRKVLLIR